MFLAQKFKEIPFLEQTWFFITLIILVTFAGIRAFEVGALGAGSDTQNYRDMFVYKRHVGLSIADFIGGIEPGFVLFQKLMQALTTNFVLFLFSIATLVVGLHLKLFKKLSENYGITMFVFIALGTYLFFFNGARQAMAASIFGFALFALHKRNFVQYALVVILAASFHKTVLVMLPMYFVFIMKFSPKQFIFLLVLTALATSGLSIVMSLAPTLLNEKYANYANRTSGGGVLLMLVYLIMNGAFLFLRKFIEEEDLKKYDVYLSLTLFTALVYLMVNVAGQDVNLIRFTLYSSFGYMFIWPIILKNIKAFKSVVPLITSGFLLCLHQQNDRTVFHQP